jgi:hypothetical protein
MRMEIDSDLDWRVEEEGADPLIFIPLVDFAKLTDPCITDAF